MALKNVKNPFKNRLSLSFNEMCDWAMNGDFWVKKQISNVSKTFSPSSLNINNIHDLMEEATPSIYYMLCWLEEYFKNKKGVHVSFKVKNVHPFYIPDDSAKVYIKLIFYNEFPDETSWPWPDGCDSKIILDFDLFKFSDLTKGENILTKIKTRINEELKKNSSDLTFVTDFVKIDINYVILHPPDAEEKMMEAYYKEKKKKKRYR